MCVLSAPGLGGLSVAHRLGTSTWADQTSSIRILGAWNLFFKMNFQALPFAFRGVPIFRPLIDWSRNAACQLVCLLPSSSPAGPAWGSHFQRHCGFPCRSVDYDPQHFAAENGLRLQVQVQDLLPEWVNRSLWGWSSSGEELGTGGPGSFFSQDLCPSLNLWP